jgi:hypothetical protein
MRPYAIAEAEVGLPTGWGDATINTLVWAHDDGPLKLIVTRPHHEAGAALASLTERHLGELRRQLARFELLHQRERSVAGGAAIDITLRFSGADHEVHQRMGTLLVAGQLLVLAALGPTSQAAAVDTLFEHLCATAALHPKEAP